MHCKLSRCAEDVYNQSQSFTTKYKARDTASLPTLSLCFFYFFFVFVLLNVYPILFGLVQLAQCTKMQHTTLRKNNCLVG